MSQRTVIIEDRVIGWADGKTIYPTANVNEIETADLVGLSSEKKEIELVRRLEAANAGISEEVLAAALMSYTHPKAWADDVAFSTCIDMGRGRLRMIRRDTENQ